MLQHTFRYTADCSRGSSNPRTRMTRTTSHRLPSLSSQTAPISASTVSAVRRPFSTSLGSPAPITQCLASPVFLPNLARWSFRCILV